MRGDRIRPGLRYAGSLALDDVPAMRRDRAEAVTFHHLHQHPVHGLNQWLRFYRPFGRGIGVVILRHEFSVTIP